MRFLLNVRYLWKLPQIVTHNISGVLPLPATEKINMRVQFKTNRFRTWQIYKGNGAFEQTIIELNNDLEHYHTLLCRDDFYVWEHIETSDCLVETQALLNSIKG